MTQPSFFALAGALLEDTMDPQRGRPAVVPVEPLLAAANHWRSFVRQGDAYLEAVEHLVQAVERAQSLDGQNLRRAVADVTAAASRFQSLTAAGYPAFRDGRERLYDAARVWHIPTSRKSVGKSPKPLAGMTDKVLLAELKSAASGFRSDTRKMLNVGAKAVRELLDAARDQPDDLNQHRQVIDQGLDFRDAVSSMFAHANGVLRRSRELTSRAWQAQRFESVGDLTLVWSHDPELGDNELI